MIAMPSSLPATAEALVDRLEEAGRALLALPGTGPSPRMVQSGFEWIRDACASVSVPNAKIRPALPSAAAISRMDEAYAWLALIPQDKYVLRRIVGARSLVDPMKDRHLFTWRRLGTAIGADHKAVQRWHAQGLGLILAALRLPPSPRPGRSSPGDRPGFA